MAQRTRLNAQLLFVAAWLLLLPVRTSGSPPQFDKPLLNIDEDITAFAFGPDGRIAFSVNRGFKTKKYDLEHDDIWISDAGGKRKRILEGNKFIRGDQPFTYAVERFSWSPNGKFLLAQLFTSTLDETGRPDDSINTLALEENGREARPGGTDNYLRNAAEASWLLDNSTFVYLTEVLKPRMLYSFKQTSLSAGPAHSDFEGRTFLDVDALPHSNIVLAIERDHALTGPPRLQRLDMLSAEDKELATLDGFEGGLRVSPSGKKILYFVDKEVLEIRDLTEPARVARLRVGLGVVQWSPDETHLLIKRSLEKKSGYFVSVAVPRLTAPPKGSETHVEEPEMRPLLHGLTIREFSISPDGRFLGIISPGKRNLQVFPFPAL
jgi:dipeptidyl aminopeptidase/acylaminoacyl peptidase